MFSHDTQHSLQTIVDLVNTDPAYGDGESLPDEAALEAFVVEQYSLGRSLREIAELVDRSQTAVRRVLDKHGVHRRPSGATPLTGAG